MTSGLPSPAPFPGPAPSQPRRLPIAPQPEKPKRRRWLAAVILAAAVLGALYVRDLQLQPITGGGPPALIVPTATVVAGPLERTLRLTGSTAAGNYAILKAPRMRGGRGGFVPEVRDISTGARGSRGGGVPMGWGGVQMMMGGGHGPQGGRMTLVSLAEAGAMVKKGDVVAEFDRENLLLRMDDFRSRLKQNDANLASVKARMEVIEKDHALSIREAVADIDRARLDMQTAPVRSAIDRERYQLRLQEAEAVYMQLQNEIPLMKESLQAQWKVAELHREEGYAELKQVQANVDRMLLKAPMDGLVVMLTTMRHGSGTQAQIKAGDQVGAGQPIMQIVDLSSMVVTASVNQADAEQVRVGAKARVRLDTYPDLELPAEVYGIGAMPRASRFRADYFREVPVTLKLLNLDQRVIPDLSVSADVVLDLEPGGVVAPLEAIFMDGPGQRPYVFLQEPQGWARREVELGKKNFLAAVVRSGLRAGDVVATDRPPVQTAGNE